MGVDARDGVHDLQPRDDAGPRARTATAISSNTADGGERAGGVVHEDGLDDARGARPSLLLTDCLPRGPPTTTSKGTEVAAARAP